jgi:hypothetical protein
MAESSSIENELFLVLYEIRPGLRAIKSSVSGIVEDDI